MRTPLLLLVSLLGCRAPAGEDATSALAEDTDTGSASADSESETTQGNPSETTGAACNGSVELSGPGPGYIYLDGRFTGLSAPRTLELELGSHHTLAVALVDGPYYQREVEVDAQLCEVALGEDERLGPTTWRALWIGIPSAEAEVDGQLCQTSSSAAELDAAFADFEWSLGEHFGPFTHETLEWEVVRQDTQAPVTVTGSGDWFDVHPGDVAEVWDTVELGDYDLVVTVWKSRGAGCTIPGAYFGLGWSPQPETKQGGFVSIKFETEDIASTIAWHHDNDPGVWIHEWLHTICEAFYPNLGLPLPAPGGDGLIVHGAETYGYAAPWMSWYADLIGGKVSAGEGEPFLGIGPAAFATCTMRQHALEPCEPWP